MLLTLSVLSKPFSLTKRINNVYVNNYHINCPVPNFFSNIAYVMHPLPHRIDRFASEPITGLTTLINPPTGPGYGCREDI